MKETPLEIINRVVEEAKDFPNPTIEYNFDELPKQVKPDNFFGVPAVENKNTPPNTAHVIFRYG